MIEYSRVLSSDFKFVRVDFYEVGGELYLGELTFTPGAGFFKYKNHEDDIRVGDMLDLCVGNTIYRKAINIFIVHYNTPDLTRCLIESINKWIPNQIKVKIYIWDNSDKLPFTCRQDNIIYIDNTKGQIINFDEWLKGFEVKSNAPYSAKHCYTIQKFIDLYNIPFLLLDSDVLLKKDISSLYDEDFAFIGQGIDRIQPFLCFINPKILKEHNVSYFDKNKMYGLNGDKKYDTGYMLFINKDKLPHKIIRSDSFIVHYTGGSYDEEVFKIKHKGQITKERWLEKNKKYWSSEGAKVVEIKKDNFTSLQKEMNKKKTTGHKSLDRGKRIKEIRNALKAKYIRHE